MKPVKKIKKLHHGLLYSYSEYFLICVLSQCAIMCFQLDHSKAIVVAQVFILFVKIFTLDFYCYTFMTAVKQMLNDNNKNRNMSAPDSF